MRYAIALVLLLSAFLASNGALKAQKSTLYFLYIDNSTTSDGFSLQSSQIDSIQSCLRACQDGRSQIVTFIRKNDRSIVDTGITRAQQFVEDFLNGQRGRKFDAWRELDIIRPRIYACVKSLLPSAIEMNFFLAGDTYEQDMESSMHPLVHAMPLEWQELWNVPTRVKLHVVRSKDDKRGLKQTAKSLPDQADVSVVFHNTEK